MNMNRKLLKKTNMDEVTDDGYARAEKHELMSMMWEIIKDAWAFVRAQDAERRLQRDVATIIRRAS